MNVAITTAAEGFSRREFTAGDENCRGGLSNRPKAIEPEIL